MLLFFLIRSTRAQCGYVFVWVSLRVGVLRRVNRQSLRSKNNSRIMSKLPNYVFEATVNRQRHVPSSVTGGEQLLLQRSLPVSSTGVFENAIAPYNCFALCWDNFNRSQAKANWAS